MVRSTTFNLVNLASPLTTHRCRSPRHLVAQAVRQPVCFTYTPPPGTASVSLTIQRLAPTGGAMVNPVRFYDGCGEWRTFVGGGPNALQMRNEGPGSRRACAQRDRFDEGVAHRCGSPLRLTRTPSPLSVSQYRERANLFADGHRHDHRATGTPRPVVDGDRPTIGRVALTTARASRCPTGTRE